MFQEAAIHPPLAPSYRLLKQIQFAFIIEKQFCYPRKKEKYRSYNRVYAVHSVALLLRSPILLRGEPLSWHILPRNNIAYTRTLCEKAKTDSISSINN